MEYEGDRPVHRVTREPLLESVEKMSKSKLNVIAPDDYVQKYGADVVRLFLMFIGPWDQGGPWNPRGVEGIVRFLNRVWAIATETAEAPRGGAEPGAVRELLRAVHRTLRKVTEDYQRFAFNTAIAAMMELTNALYRLRESAAGAPEWRDAIEKLVLMLAPIAPHLAEELWERLGRPYSVHLQPWPQWIEEYAAEETVEIAVQIDGRVRERLRVPVGADEASVREAVLRSEKVRAALEGREIRKFVYVPGRLVNLVVR